MKKIIIVIVCIFSMQQLFAAASDKVSEAYEDLKTPSPRRSARISSETLEGFLQSAYRLASINDQNSQGKTLLQMAIAAKNGSLIDVLIEVKGIIFPPVEECAHLDSCTLKAVNEARNMEELRKKREAETLDFDREEDDSDFEKYPSGSSTKVSGNSKKSVLRLLKPVPSVFYRVYNEDTGANPAPLRPSETISDNVSQEVSTPVVVVENASLEGNQEVPSRIMTHKEMLALLSPLTEMTACEEILRIVGLLNNPQFKINEPDSHGSTILHHFCGANNLLAVRLLLDAGAAPNIQTRSGSSPLTYAIRDGHVDIVRELVCYPDIEIRECDKAAAKEAPMPDRNRRQILQLLENHKD